jgi:glycosyltransferase involved in cell wall biosynthesis
MSRLSDAEIAIVGGIPGPIGGITNFIYRIAEIDTRVRQVFDFYPARNKSTLSSAEHICFDNRLFTYLRLLVSCFWFRRRIFHLNVSKINGLIPFLPIIILFSERIRITAHHGNLSFNKSNILHAYLVKYLLPKVNCIYSLSNLQHDFYKKISGTCKIKSVSSFVPFPTVSKSFECSNFCVCISGYPSKIYNYRKAINVLGKLNDITILLFVYGHGDDEDYLLSLENSYSNVKVFWDTDNPSFLECLSGSNLYLRLSSVDSFGVACAEAVSMGVPVIATNVCQRYGGCYLIDPNIDDSELSDNIYALMNGVLPNLPLEDDGVVPFSYD